MNNRINTIRALSCILIVLTHIFQYQNLGIAYWLNSAVCTFFLMSGVLNDKPVPSNKKKWYCEKLKKMMVPYYLFLIIILISYSIINFEISNNTLIFYMLNLQAFITPIKGLGNLWYMTVIVFCYLITPYLRQIKRRNLFLMLATVFLGFLFILKILPAQICSGIFCFIFGLFHSDIFLNQKNKKIYNLVLVSLIIFIILNILFKDFYFVSYVFSLIRYPILGISFYYLVYYSNKYINFFERIFPKTLKYISMNSFEIYLVHVAFILGPLSLMEITKSFSLNLLLMIVIVVLLSKFLRITSNLIIQKLD